MIIPNTVTKLKEEYRQMLLASETLQGIIADALGKKTQTVRRWITVNDERLTMFTVLREMRKFYRLPEKAEMIEEGPMTPAPGGAGNDH